jgi:hypothetical protein
MRSAVVRGVCRAVLVALSTSLVLGQTGARTATSAATIAHFPVFFDSRPVSLVVTPVQIAGFWHVPIQAPRSLVILPQSGGPPSAPVEVDGVLFDVGHLASDDPRVETLGIRAVVQAVTGGTWPDRGMLFVITNATWATAPPPEATLRAIVLSPDAFDGMRVTVRGRFRGQNLYGDVPAWPRHSQWDFVLRRGDASLWVTGLRPRGKGFDLDPTSRRGSSTWLTVTGTLRIENDLPRLDATSIAPAPAEDEPASDAPPAPASAEPPPTVIFSAPVDGETGVSPSAPVRIQFSRDMAGGSFADHVRVRYGSGTTDPPPSFTSTYQALTRGVEIRFKAPLARGATAVVELLDGITASDGRPLVPTTITFAVQR